MVCWKHSDMMDPSLPWRWRIRHSDHSRLSGNLQAVRSFKLHLLEKIQQDIPLNRQVVAEPLPTQQVSHFSNFLKQLEPRLAAVQLQMELRALQWSFWMYIDIVDVLVGLRLSFQEQVDAAQRLLVGGCKNLSLAQRFTYDHSNVLEFIYARRLRRRKGWCCSSRLVVSCQV